jgi:glyoxylase-like metal-dependent hydrolase (beta-lactamase superfamily II)
MLKKKLLRTGLALALAACAAVLSGPALAGAPAAQTAAPGYYRMMLGDFEVTALSDGTVPLPMNKLLTGIKQEDAEAALARSFLGSPTETSVNAFLINTGTKLVMVDTGAAGLFGPTLGRLLASLKAAGYQPEQVDEIYITHLHGDHVGGLMAGGKMAFPNAVVRVDQHDADFWLSKANMDKAGAEEKGAFQGATTSLNPYVQAGKLKTFEGDTELVPGVRAMATHGHTPGHSVYLVESKGQKLVLWGDLMHVAAVQFDDPTVTIAFDSDSKAALAQRQKVFAMAAKDGYIVGAAHISFPGFGRLRAEGKGYVWVPVNYTPVK